jgi:hypothetical protein
MTQLATLGKTLSKVIGLNARFDPIRDLSDEQLNKMLEIGYVGIEINDCPELTTPPSSKLGKVTQHLSFLRIELERLPKMSGRVLTAYVSRNYGTLLSSLESCLRNSEKVDVTTGFSASKINYESADWLDRMGYPVLYDKSRDILTVQVGNSGLFV